MEKICADYRILLFTGARQAIMDCFLALYAYCPGSKRTSTLTNKLSTPVVRKKIQICFELWLTPSNSFPHRHIHKVIMQLEKQIYSNLQLTQIGLFPFLVKKYLHTCMYLWNHRNLLISFGWPCVYLSVIIFTEESTPFWISEGLHVSKLRMNYKKKTLISLYMHRIHSDRNGMCFLLPPTGFKAHGTQ